MTTTISLQPVTTLTVTRRAAGREYQLQKRRGVAGQPYAPAGRCGAG